jgi:hypothetical protein
VFQIYPGAIGKVLGLAAKFRTKQKVPVLFFEILLSNVLF